MDSNLLANTELNYTFSTIQPYLPLISSPYPQVLRLFIWLLWYICDKELFGIQLIMKSLQEYHKLRIIDINQLYSDNIKLNYISSNLIQKLNLHTRSPSNDKSLNIHADTTTDCPPNDHNATIIKKRKKSGI